MQGQSHISLSKVSRSEKKKKKKKSRGRENLNNMINKSYLRVGKRKG